MLCLIESAVPGYLAPSVFVFPVMLIKSSRAFGGCVYYSLLSLTLREFVALICAFCSHRSFDSCQRLPSCFCMFYSSFSNLHIIDLNFQQLSSSVTCQTRIEI